MDIDADGIKLLMISEGLVLHAYVDPGTGGEPITIGYGHTGGVRMGDVCTQEQAEAWLRSDCEWATALVNELVTVPLTQGQFNSLTSFAFNMGPGAKGVKDGFRVLANGNVPTIRRNLDAQNYAGAANEFPKWANPPLPGLVIRRARERNMFLGRDWRLIGSVDQAQASNAIAA